MNKNKNENEIKNDASNLPLRTFDDIPEPNKDAKQIVALVKDSGRVTGYKLSDGTIVNKTDGIKLAKQGGITGVGVASRNGNEYLKALPDGDDNNNLSNLPSVN
ncbi:hypothetical protein SDC9_134941 [bioreactor metagenome]|uniref:DUF3892 domain-containing protein n=1 Tax=bioreactor metagenome TaxID=1076179 RepID=A0A645DF17_9ZZZZ|nr:DUF3892 domain-containing protein [Oscillospiraceae bacterium]